MKAPEQCENMQDIRCEIDRIDRDIIALLGQRYGYVKAAAKFKTSAGSVKAQDRVAAMLLQRRVWAEEHELSAEMVEKLYRDLVNYCVREEMERWKEEQDWS
jgi:isochorismate pyruvate lyase